MAGTAQLKMTREISHENAYDIIAKLTNKEEFSSASLVAVSGDSDEFGAILVIVPPLGNSLLIPFASQSESAYVY